MSGEDVDQEFVALEAGRVSDRGRLPVGGYSKETETSQAFSVRKKATAVDPPETVETKVR